jgi:NADH dehydrogenase [ubiquinone] 1 alpha subcomplex assembly factor 7
MSDTPYDPNLRRDTPLARKLIARIKACGPITVHDYMDACLNDAEFGYYRTQKAIGRAGDFITAPEISQVFGELIGLWCAVVWQQMGAPPRFNLVELGAGRGTLLADALRATRIVPGFREAVSLHILDQNPVLIEQQRAALTAMGIACTWHATLETLPSDLPSIWVANEFLDTVPVHQYERHDDRWRSRAIGLDASGQLAFVAAPADWPVLADTDLPSHTAQHHWESGEIYESQSWDYSTLRRMQKVTAIPAFAALFMDYGYVGQATIDTLQAVRAHRAEDVLTSPGEADLSCHVDFENFAACVGDPAHGGNKLASDGPVTQAEFLGQLGIVERASRLMAANPDKANALEMGVARLIAPQGMGTRFKAIGVRSAALPPLPGFQVLK